MSDPSFMRGMDTGVLPLTPTLSECPAGFDDIALVHPSGSKTCIHPTATVLGTFEAGALIGESAFIAEGAHLGADASLGDMAQLQARATVGEGTGIGASTVVGRTAQVGAFTTLGPDSVIGRSATVGARVDASSGDLTVGYAASLGDDCVIAGAPVTVGSLVSVGSDCQLGAGTVLGRGTQLGQGAVLGSGVVVGPAVIAGDGLALGQGVRVRKQATFGSDVTIQSGARIGRSSTFGDDATVGQDAQLSANVRLTAGAAVEANARVGRGVVVEPVVPEEPLSMRLVSGALEDFIITGTPNDQGLEFEGSLTVVEFTNHTNDTWYLDAYPGGKLRRRSGEATDCSGSLPGGTSCQIRFVPYGTYEGERYTWNFSAFGYDENFEEFWSGPSLSGTVTVVNASPINVVGNPVESTITGTTQGVAVGGAWQALTFVNEAPNSVNFTFRDASNVEQRSGGANPCSGGSTSLPAGGSCTREFRLLGSSNGTLAGEIELSPSAFNWTWKRIWLDGTASGFSDVGVPELVPGDVSATVTRYGWTARCTAWEGSTCMQPELFPTTTTAWDTGVCGEGTDGFPRDIPYGVVCTSCGNGQDYNQLAVRDFFCKIATDSMDGTMAGMQGAVTIQSGAMGAIGAQGRDRSSGGVSCPATGSAFQGVYSPNPVSGIPGSTYNFYGATTDRVISRTRANIDCNGW